jgi:predicted phage terminase large subunit-like protein
VQATRIRYTDPQPSAAELAQLAAPYAMKLRWMMEHGYTPHYHQIRFHTLTDPDTGRICRFRSLTAGRRGGKTTAAAEEVVYYIENPSAYWWDFHNVESNDPLHGWVLSPNSIVGRAALLTVRRALRRTKLRGWAENRAGNYFDHQNGSLLEFKTAVDPESLVGMGLHFMWLDEAGRIPTQDAYDVASPALSDHEGMVMATTTPKGKNWFYREFFGPDSDDDPAFGSVEYRSLDNPHFKRREWEYRKRRYHPLMFKQEYEASFDSMAGKELSGQWLAEHFYTDSDLEDHEGRRLQLTRYMAVDPAISLSDDADYFAMTLWGVTQDARVFLLDTYRGRLPFPDQLDLIQDWHLQHRPMIIGVEAVAYQAALAQALMRLASMPPIAEIHTREKKSSRILAMSPLFRIGRARIRSTHKDFIDEWLGYDSQQKNPQDDLLDAAEIGLRVAGVLIPPVRDDWDDPAHGPGSIEEAAWQDHPARRKREPTHDPTMGLDY